MTTMLLALLLTAFLQQFEPYRATWEPEPSATSYVILIDGVEVGRPTTTTFTGTVQRGNHTFRVAAVNSWGQGPFTDVTVHVGSPNSPNNFRVLPNP